MTPLNALLLSDGRPGHYHLAEGVLAAIARRRPVEITKLDIKRRALAPARTLAGLLNKTISPALVLRLGYGIRPRDLSKADLPKFDLVVSAGGQTIAANVAAARLTGAANIFCGSLRHVRPQDMALTISSYKDHASRPQHIIALKPSGLDPDQLAGLSPGDVGTGRKPERQQFGPGAPPAIGGLLIGGKSGQFTFEAADWDQLITFISASHQAHGTTWIISTSRRTDDEIADRLGALARQDNSPICDYIDFRFAGPGTLLSLFARTEAILCTADSSTMISEAVCARRPVVGIEPAHHSYTAQEEQYRQFMSNNCWTTTLPLGQLSPDTWLEQLAQIEPLRENHLDRLAAQLAERLPQLF